MIARVAKRIEPFLGPTVWQEFTPLSIAHKSVNLGQGFPDWQAPPFVIQSEVAAVSEHFNQYARSAGHLPLANAIASKYSPVFGRELDGASNVVVTVGASQVLYTIFQSFCEVGDEVVMFSPVFDIYVPQVVMSGATPVYSPLVLRGGAWEVDWENLERCVTERTRVLVVNTPHNPTGKVFSQADLERIAAIARRFPRLLVVSDEVYEHMLFDNLAHKNLASILFDQTITVSSSGKTFSVTGWKVGWAIAPKEICVGLATTQQWTSFSISTPHQEAVSRALALAKQPYESHPDYYSWLTAMYSTKRDHLLTTLRRAGLKPITPQGSFFILADIADVQIPATYTDAGQPRDYAFCRWLTKEVGVTAIPCSAFFPEGQKHLGANLARFAFCKKDESLEEARVRLFKAFGDNEKK